MRSPAILSVVVPNYNFGRFLRELLIDLNSLEHRHRLEVLVVDGGSTDESLEFAREFLLPQDKLLLGPDDGQADAIGKGLQAATGIWFMFQNSDDLFDLSSVNGFLAKPPEPGSYDVVAFDQDILVEGHKGWTRRRAFQHNGPIGWRQLFWSIYYTNQATIYDRHKAREIGFDAGKRFAMDYDFVVRFFKRHNPSVLFVARPLGMQRLHGDTKTSTMQPICKAESADIRRTEFFVFDRILGFSQAVLYHARKRLVGRKEIPIEDGQAR